MSPWSDIEHSAAAATATQFRIEFRAPVGGGYARQTEILIGRLPAEV